MKDLLLVVVLVILFGLTLVTGTFIQSLPGWCANPSGNGNWVVQPLCK